MNAFFEMGGYAVYVWPAYGVAFAGLIGLAIVSLCQRARLRRELRVTNDNDQ